MWTVGEYRWTMRKDKKLAFTCFCRALPKNYSRGSLNVLCGKTAIWARVTGLPGQVMPSLTSCSIQASAKDPIGTSLKVVPVVAAGV